MDDRPLVTIGIPTRNRSTLLQRAIASAQAQTHEALEIIVSDNGSTDDTAAVVEKFAAADHRITLLRQPRNMGPSANFEAVRERATGTYFMWLADDDWLATDYVASCLAVLEKHPGTALAAGAASYYTNEGFHHEAVRVEALSADADRRVLELFRQIDDNATFYGLIPASILEQVSPLTDRMGADWLLVAELALLGPVRLVPDTHLHRDFVPTYTFRQMARSLGLPRLAGHLPYVWILASAFADIAWRTPVYRQLGLRRALTATRVAAIIARRFVITGLRPNSLRRRLRDGATAVGLRRR